MNATTTGDQQLPSVACLNGGEFVVVWESPDDDDTGVVGRVFGNTGAPLAGEFPINETTDDRQSAPAVCSDAAGNFVKTISNRDDLRFFHDPARGNLECVTTLLDET